MGEHYGITAVNKLIFFDRLEIKRIFYQIKWWNFDYSVCDWIYCDQFAVGISFAIQYISEYSSHYSYGNIFC